MRKNVIKKTMLFLLIGVVMFPFSAQALEWECKEMKTFVDSMYDAATYLNDKPNFDENPEIEKNIDKLIPTLKAIAADEDIDAFTNALNKMTTVWNKDVWKGDDIGNFRRALDSVALNLERIYDKYCD